MNCQSRGQHSILFFCFKMIATLSLQTPKKSMNKRWELQNLKDMYVKLIIQGYILSNIYHWVCSSFHFSSSRLFSDLLSEHLVNKMIMYILFYLVSLRFGYWNFTPKSCYLIFFTIIYFRHNIHTYLFQCPWERKH